VRSPIIILIQHFRQWTVPHHSAQTVTAGLVINVASSYIFISSCWQKYDNKEHGHGIFEHNPLKSSYDFCKSTNDKCLRNWSRYFGDRIMTEFDKYNLQTA
jgi:hypothetical protein